MKQRNKKYNEKRRLLKIQECDFDSLKKMAQKAGYGGNPEHKRNPGDFGLTPPSNPRPGKALCDVIKIFSRKEALKLLREGITQGLVSDRTQGEWPKNVWSVMNDGTTLEAQLENPQQGTYHGYPLDPDDAFAGKVVEQWKKRHESNES